MVVRLAAENGHSTVDLFYEEHTYHLMGEGHLA